MEMERRKIKKKLNVGGLAVGAYLRVLREHLNMSSTEVAAELKTDPTQIWRLESWKSDVRSSILFGYIRLVKGSAEDVAKLMSNPDAGVMEGEELARKRISIQEQ